MELIATRKPKIHRGSTARWDFEYHDDAEDAVAPAEPDLQTDGKEVTRVSRINTENVSRKFGLQAATDLIVSPESLEKDDMLHDPAVEDIRTPSNCVLPSNRSGMVNCLGFSLIILGVLMILVGLPVISTIEDNDQYMSACEEDPDCIRADLPLLQNVRHGPVDPDTPSSVKTRTDIHGNPQNLVFSDEFNKDGRTFYPGDDPYFQAEDFWYGVTQDLEWYDPDAISTANGTLNIQFDKHDNHNLSFRSGMINSWNKLCFKGGYIEANVSLPGSASVPGLWPGFWSSGNLGRAGYAATTDGMWPYSYWDQCDAGILPNQSAPNGISWLPGMRLPACTCNASDTRGHPTPGKSRSAPEMDILEGSVAYLGPGKTDPTGTGSQSIQAAPFDPSHFPNFSDIVNFNTSTTFLNQFKGSLLQESISYITNLDSAWYDGNEYVTFGVEYQPGADGYATFFIGSKATWHIDAAAIGPDADIGQRLIPVEPMTLIANLGMSPTFADIDWEHLVFPAIMRVDYIRIWQNVGNESAGHWLGCDPPGYASTGYIKEHPRAYLDWNRTTWEEAGYSRPRNRLRDGCEMD
ncbi:MAG: hypothetical protein Q9159_006583 [Coniocarpon cinnabarinum]